MLEYPIRLPLVVIAADFGVCVLAGGTMVRTAEGRIHGIDPAVDSHEYVVAG